MLQPIYSFLESARGYQVSQLLGLPTIRRNQAFIRKYVPKDPARRVLEIGCGVASYRDLFPADYTGIDINPDYITLAERRKSGRFFVMDAARMTFPHGEFDDAVTVATTHHLDDAQLGAMVANAVLVACKLHVIDAILPLSPSDHLKRMWFRMDRGRFARTFEDLQGVVSRNARIECSESVTGPLHDVCYLGVTRLN